MRFASVFVGGRENVEHTAVNVIHFNRPAGSKSYENVKRGETSSKVTWSVCLWVVLSDWANWIHSLPAGDHQEQRKAFCVENVQFQSNRKHCSRHDWQSSSSFLFLRQLSLNQGQFKQHHLIQSHADLPKKNIHIGAFQMNLQKFTVELSRI